MSKHELTFAEIKNIIHQLKSPVKGIVVLLIVAKQLPDWATSGQEICRQFEKLIKVDENSKEAATFEATFFALYLRLQTWAEELARQPTLRDLKDAYAMLQELQAIMLELQPPLVPRTAPLRDLHYLEPFMSFESYCGEDWSEANLRGLNMSDMGFSRVNLRGSDLRGCNLRGASLDKTNLRGADLRGCDLFDANLHGAKIDFQTQLDAHGRFWYRMSNGGMVNENLQGVDLSGAGLSGVDLRGADLRQANLSHSRFRYIDLCWADLRGANLEDAYLEDAYLYQAQIDDLTQLDEPWRLSWFILNDKTVGKSLRQVQVRSGFSLSRAYLVEADLQGAEIAFVTLQAADLQRANLSQAVLNSVDLRGANLTGANLTGVRLQQVRYDSRTQWPLGFNPQVHDTILDKPSAFLPPLVSPRDEL